MVPPLLRGYSRVTPGLLQGYSDFTPRQLRPSSAAVSALLQPYSTTTQPLPARCCSYSASTLDYSQVTQPSPPGEGLTPSFLNAYVEVAQDSVPTQILLQTYSRSGRGLYSGLTQFLVRSSSVRPPCSELTPGFLLELLTLSLLSTSRQNLLQTYSRGVLTPGSLSSPLLRCFRYSIATPALLRGSSARFAPLCLRSALTPPLLSASAGGPRSLLRRSEVTQPLLRGYSAVPVYRLGPRSSPPPSSTPAIPNSWPASPYSEVAQALLRGYSSSSRRRCAPRSSPGSCGGLTALDAYSEVTKALEGGFGVPQRRRRCCYSTFTQTLQSPSSAYSAPPQSLLQPLLGSSAVAQLTLYSRVTRPPVFPAPPALPGLFSEDTPRILLLLLRRLLRRYSPFTLPGRAQPILWGPELLLRGYSALAILRDLEVTRGLLR